MPMGGVPEKPPSCHLVETQMHILVKVCLLCEHSLWKEKSVTIIKWKSTEKWYMT